MNQRRNVQETAKMKSSVKKRKAKKDIEKMNHHQTIGSS